MSPIHNDYKNRFHKIFSLLYIILISQVVLFIIQKQFNRPTNEYILWISISLIISIIISEILLNFNKYIIIFEIIVLAYLLHTLFIPVTGLLGSDAQIDFHLIKLINEYNWSLRLDSPLVAWPALHIMINIYSIMIGISLLDTTRFFPSVISTVALLFLFCISNKIYKNYYVALFYILLTSTIYYYFFFHSLPVRENLGFVILFAALYSFIGSTEQIGKNKFLFLGLALFFGLFLLITHHFSLFIYNLFLISIYMAVSIYQKFQNSYNSIIYPENILKYINITKYLVVIVVATISYWVFISIDIFSKFIFSIRNFLTFGDIIKVPFDYMKIYPLPVDIRYQILTHSREITFIMVILIICYNLFIQKDKLKTFEVSILLFTLFTFIEWLVTTIGYVEMSIYPERFELFAWTFLLILLSKILFNNLLNNNKLPIKIISIVFILSFVTMNFSQISPYIYDPSQKPHYENGQIRLTYLPQEYSIVTWFKEKVTKNRITIRSDGTIEDILLNDIKGEVITDSELFSGNLSLIQSENILIIRQEMFERIMGTRNDYYLIKKPLNLSVEIYNRIDGDKNLKKIYTNKEVDVFLK